MKLFITLALIVYSSSSFSQWTRVQELPASEITSLFHKDSILYAGGKNIVYISRDKGHTWDSTTAIPQFFQVDNIIVYRDEIYVACFSIGVFKSADEGNSWQNITVGIIPFVMDFVEWRGDLYAATSGSSMFKLDPITHASWLPFNNGLSNLSVNLTAIGANNNALVAGSLANGLYDYLPANTTNWEERFLLGQISPNEGVYDIITAHDTMFLAGSTGRLYTSTDNGLNWNLFSQALPSTFTSLVNAKQALLLARNTFNVQNNTTFYYLKKDSLQFPFVQFSSVQDHFSFKLDIVGDRAWDASTKGLFYMPLSVFPGITNAEDSVTNIPLPIRFISINMACEENRVKITWKTGQEENTGHFEIERSPDSINWTVIGDLPAAGTSNIETSYSFTDKTPVQNGYYRIAEYDLDGTVNYTSVVRSSCNTTNDAVSLWPNPVIDIVTVQIITANQSQAVIRVFDSKGALVRIQKAAVLPGTNQLRVDMGSLANGVYTLYIGWNNGKMKKGIPVLKQ